MSKQNLRKIVLFVDLVEELETMNETDVVEIRETLQDYYRNERDKAEFARKALNLAISYFPNLQEKK